MILGDIWGENLNDGDRVQTSTNFQVMSNF